jgi:hypothetical protein
MLCPNLGARGLVAESAIANARRVSIPKPFLKLMETSNCPGEATQFCSFAAAAEGRRGLVAGVSPIRLANNPCEIRGESKRGNWSGRV